MENELLTRLEDNGAEVEDVLDRLMGDQTMYLDYLHQFAASPATSALADAVGRQDYELAAREVHTLKGMALNLGLLPLADVCMDMLLDFRSGETAAAAARLPQVEAACAQWQQLILG